MKLVRMVIVAVVGLLLGLFGPALPTYACSIARTDNGQFNYDGWQRSLASSDEAGGVYATLDVRAPYITPKPHYYSGAKVELAGNSQRANFGWAWQENGDSSGAQIWVSEVWPCSGGGTCQAYDLYDKPAVNTSHTFTVLVSLSDLGLITFQYDGTTADTEYGPALFLPYIGNISGMINSLSDQMPGSIANPANYNQPFIYDGNLQRWVHFNGTASNTSSTYFGNSIVYDMSGNQVDGLTWDKNCSS